MSSAKILWGSEPPEHIANPGPAQLLYLGPTADDLCPGLLTLSGGVRSFKYRLEQEERTFSTFVYFSGFKVPAWKATFQIWNRQQYEEMLRLYKKYSPRPITSLKKHLAVQVSNPILNEHGYRMMLINDWAPPAAPQPGMYYEYSFVLIEAFPRRFVPKPASDSKDKGLVRDIPQETDRAIKPSAELERKWNQYRKIITEPQDVYQTPAKPKVFLNSLGESPDMTPETPYSDWNFEPEK